MNQRSFRDAIAARIQAATGITPKRAPRYELGREELPAICVFGRGDRPESEEDDHQKQHHRIYTVRVEIQVEGRAEDDATDALADLVRHAVLADDSLGLLADRTTWSSQEWSGDEGEWPLAGTAIEFNVFYLWRP